MYKGIFFCMATDQSDSNFLLEAPEPSFPNSAGRMLALLEGLSPAVSYYAYASSMFKDGLAAPGYIQARLYLKFMTMLEGVHDELFCDIRAALDVNEETRRLLEDHLISLRDIVFPVDPARPAPRGLSETERAFLKVAGSALQKEEQIAREELDEVRRLVDALMNELTTISVDASVRESLMELARQARYALDYYSIRGAKGFREAFKRMLTELLVVLYEEGDEAKQQEWWSKATNLLARIDALAGRFVKYKPLLEAGGRFLLSGS